LVKTGGIIKSEKELFRFGLEQLREYLGPVWEYPAPTFPALLH